MTKNGFTLEEHRDVGAKLGLIRDELISLSVKIGNKYSQKLCDDLDDAVKLLDRERPSLDDRVFKENFELDDNVLTNIYYGDLSGTRQNEELFKKTSCKSRMQ